MARPAYANRTFTAYYVKERVEVVAVDPREGGYVDGSDTYSEGGSSSLVGTTMPTGMPKTQGL